MHILLFMVTCWTFGGVAGVELTFERQKSPEDSNCVLTCSEKVSGEILSVQEFHLFNIAEQGSRLASVVTGPSGYVDAGDKVVVEKESFRRTAAYVRLSLLDRSVCERGAFMCEVVFISANSSTGFAVVTDRPNKETWLEEIGRQISQVLTSSATAINSSIRRFEQILTEDRLQPAFILKQVWKLAFRGTAHVKKSVFHAYKFGSEIPQDVEPGCTQLDSHLPCNSHYRNNAILDNWRDVSEVALVIYKDNVRVGYVIFDGIGSNVMNWMSQSRIKISSWSDMKSKAANYISIDGHVAHDVARRFFMNHRYNGCLDDVGWFVAVDDERGHCPWGHNEAFPVFLYSKTQNAANWASHDVGRADFFAVFVKYLSLP